MPPELNLCSHAKRHTAQINNSFSYRFICIFTIYLIIFLVDIFTSSVNMFVNVCVFGGFVCNAKG